MRTQHEFLLEMLSLLESAGVPYMVAGSIASTYHGRPRSTQDVDLVIDAGRDRVQAFVQLCRERRCYADPVDADDALLHRSMFNIVDPASGYKLDVIIRKDRPFSHEEFARRRAANVPGGTVFMVSAEDAILSKLEWAREGDSERQYRDALGIVLTQGPRLDSGYLRRWARELGVAEYLERLERESSLETDKRG